MLKKLGQHFLIDEKKIKKFVDALDLKSGETIIEIGPGHGELTTGIKHQVSPKQSKLATGQASIKIVAIEKDEKFVQLLRKKFALDKNIEIIEGDALKILKSYTLHLKSYKIVGNIPFYITGYLFRILGELKNKPSLIVFFFQKEVAQRICAIPPKMNLLAASIQFWAEPEIIDYISKKDFRPMPKVDSAIIALTPIYADNKQINAEKYYKLIKVLFKQPRKTILNNLATSDKRQATRKEEIATKIKKIGINPQDRPQNLDIKQIEELSTLF
jgi:16S rRNA (adenine1518-N6/adenine1519-N6)-dimethyltransferase